MLHHAEPAGAHVVDAQPEVRREALRPRSTPGCVDAPGLGVPERDDLGSVGNCVVAKSTAVDVGHTNARADAEPCIVELRDRIDGNEDALDQA